MSYGTRHTTTAGVRRMGSNLFGTCSTGSGTTIKIVDLPDFDVLVEGVTIHVKFEYGNAVSAPALKVGPTSAVAIRRNGSTEGRWAAGSVVSFTYDGAFWQQNDFYDTSGASNTYSLGQSGNNITLYENGSAKNTVSITSTMLHVVKYSRSVTIAAKNKKSIIDNSWDISIDGYTPLGVVGFNLSGTGAEHIATWNISLHPHTTMGGAPNYLHAQFTNRDSTNYTVAFDAWVLYARYPLM